MSATVTIIGDDSFLDAYEPAPGKNEWGMDTLTRGMRGGQTKLAAYVAGLSQGATFSFGGQTFYLQTWEPDSNPVFPTVSLHYKGLTGGIPTPKASGQQIEQNITITCSSPQSASRDIAYISRQTRTLYITSGRPTGSTYGLDVDLTPYITASIIRTDDGGIFYATAPAGLVSALTPAVETKSFMSCNPVVGSPYFECEDVATKLFKQP